MKVNKKMFKQLSEKESVSMREFADMKKDTIPANTPPNNFHFKVHGRKLDDGKIQLEVIGKHYAKNRMNNWHRGIKLKYKKAIKQAFNLYFMIHGKKLIPETPFELSQITYIVKNPRSRDDDANFDSLKAMRDCLTVHGIIKDDNRKCLLPTIEHEEICKEYSVSITIERKPIKP